MKMGFQNTSSKTMKIDEYHKLNEALYIQFYQQRELNIPVKWHVVSRENQEYCTRNSIVTQRRNLHPVQLFSGDFARGMC